MAFRDYSAAYAREDAAGMDEDVAAERLRGFDANAGFDRWMQGAQSRVSDRLRRTLRDTAGEATAAGRFDTGFFDEDRGTVIRNVMDDFNNTVAERALQAQGQQLDATRSLGEMGGRRRERALDLMTAERQFAVEEEARRRAERRARRGAWGQVAGAVIGGTLGSVVPGIGTKIGATLGAGLGGSFG